MEIIRLLEIQNHVGISNVFISNQLQIDTHKTVGLTQFFFWLAMIQYDGQGSGDDFFGTFW